ncbi:MAG: hypothetical protein JWN61_1341 [Pseudonocardiales bacterium]|nr:hypothetical protein [Pseudonocardiales bacterium]
MRPGALEPYESALERGTALALHDGAGRSIDMDVRRWMAPPDAADRSVLRRCGEPVLDIGSGPGRLVRALSESGAQALGIDIAPAAVAHSIGSGAPAVRASVFDPLPNEGLWSTALLIDGNIGIGGDVRRLLRRVRGLVAADGLILVETTGSEYEDVVLDARFAVQSGGGPLSALIPTGPSFLWAVVGVRALRAHAARVGCQIVEEWSSGDRSFSALRPAFR